MKTSHYFLHAFAALVFAVIYDSALASLPMQSYLLAIILIAVAANPRFAYLWSVILGVFLDSSLNLPTGVLLASLLLVTLFTHFCLNNIFPSRSIYSLLVLTPMATLILQTVRYLVPPVFRMFAVSEFYLEWNLLNAGKLLIVNTLMTVGLFLIYYFLRARWQNTFLVK